MMEGGEPFLDIGACAHFFGGPQQNTDPTGIHAIEQHLFLLVSVRMVNVGNVFLGNTESLQFRAEFIVDVKPVSVRGRQIAEYRLGEPLLVAVRPYAVNSPGGLAHF